MLPLVNRAKAESAKQAIQQRVDNIDRIILSLNTIIRANTFYQFDFDVEIQKIRDNIDSQTNKLKEIIEKKSKELISELIDVKANNNRKFTEIYNYISSLSDERFSLENIIEKGSDVEIRKKNMFKTDALILQHTKFIQIERPIFTMPLIDAESLQAKDLFGSIQNIQIDGKIDFLKIKALSEIYLTKFLFICAMKQDLFILDFPNLHVYDMDLNNFKSSIYIRNNIAINFKTIDMIGISNVLFIVFKKANVGVKESIIYKFDLKNYICSEWKTMNSCCISSTNHATILAITDKRELIEFSIDGVQLKLIKYSVEAPKEYFKDSYQLVDGRYVVTEEDDQIFHLHLIDSKGNVIKSNSIKHSGYTTMCTDNDKYIFVGDYKRSIIIVFSIELNKIREFYFNKLFKIYSDRENKRLLVRTLDGKILFVNYNEESFKDI